MIPIRFLLAWGTMVSCAFACFNAIAAETKRRPNIIVILADDVGWGDAGCYGATLVKTPNIDRLASDGQRFQNGHASAAVCTPTRYSLITGQYSWRRDAVGLNKSVAPGDSPLLIPTEMTTAPGLLKQAGYRTAIIGKWHLGFGTTKPDFNQELRPGPLEIGFDEFFGIPATNDRIPTVFVRDYRVLGLDPNDPLEYSFNEGEAKRAGMSPWAAGRNRIGWSKGGKSAWWKDTEIADIHTRECIQFIERNKDKSFFLLYTPHNVHAPAIPHPRFAGTSGLSNRADMLHEFDASLGEILQTLDRLELAQDTLVIYSSDNGAYINDEEGHRPTGNFRGKKSQLWEGGHRVPFIVRWPAKIQPGLASGLASTIDIPATICAAAGVDVPSIALPDSYDLLPEMLGEENAPRREYLVLMSGTGERAIRSFQWKYIPDLAVADGWYGSKKKSPGTSVRPGLFDLSKDPAEANNVAEENPEIVARLQSEMNRIQNMPSSRLNH